MKGTHFPSTKKQLSDIERELVTKLLNLTEGTSSLLTARTISEFMSWDIRQTTSTLSNIVGLDLCIETDADPKVTNIHTHQFSSKEPVYGIPMNSVYHKRAVYARDRTFPSSTLFDLLKGNPEYGEKLWPFRPTDRVKIEGRVKLDKFDKPLIVLTYRPDDFREMVGSNVSVVVKLKP